MIEHVVRLAEASAQDESFGVLGLVQAPLLHVAGHVRCAESAKGALASDRLGSFASEVASGSDLTV